MNTKLTSFPNGAVVPFDEPAKAAACADHLLSFGAVATPLVAAAHAVVEAPFVYSGQLNLNTELASVSNGAVVPVDEPAVAAARAEQLGILGVI